MKNFTTSTVLLGSTGVAMMSILSGCEAPQEEMGNKFLVIEQTPNGKYKVVEEHPTDGPSRAIIREYDQNGVMRERFMNEDEMKQLAAQEYAKVQDGTSETIQSGSADAGMGLAGTILAVAAGSLLGNMIGNALMNNKNFQNRSNSVNRSAYHRSAGAKKAAMTKKSPKKSFFGGSSRSSSYGSRSYGS